MQPRYYIDSKSATFTILIATHPTRFHTAASNIPPLATYLNFESMLAELRSRHASCARAQKMPGSEDDP
jgi:hypothetical protein